MRSPALPLVLCLLLAPALCGCRSAYYSTMEAFGVHKRDLLVQRVEEARDAQGEVKEQFADALEAFRGMQGFDGGDLGKLYDKLKARLEASEAGVAQVKARIVQVEKVSSDLFREWKAEADSIQDPSLREQSEALQRSTQRSYEDLLAAMKRAEGKMDPVLTRFRDQVLFLKHNLNASAIGSLAGTLVSIESDVGALIADMESSIAEADEFLASMGGAPNP
ncbi:MAG: DUF2959 family protein [Planctomycetaceae bacterium]|nr:DUF2959 family protein [Planctomycetaceae bacterium]